MRFYNRQHRYYCGIDLHVKTMYICILDAAGQVLVHRNVKSTPEAFLETIAPYRDDLVVAAECMFTWYWLADLCAVHARLFAREKSKKRNPRTRPSDSPCPDRPKESPPVPRTGSAGRVYQTGA